jgi:hypothetical protein
MAGIGLVIFNTPHLEVWLMLFSSDVRSAVASGSDREQAKAETDHYAQYCRHRGRNVHRIERCYNARVR